MLESIIGFTAALATTFCLLPQLYKITVDKNLDDKNLDDKNLDDKNLDDKNLDDLYIYIEKKTDALDATLLNATILSAQSLWAIYGVLINDNIVIYANLTSALLSLLIVLYIQNKININ
jgi:uncharacterized protein with PQ loop repeat